MQDRRQCFRGRVYLGGRIAFHNRKPTIDCIVRNLSPWGARIELNCPSILPDEIDLAIERKGMAFIARLVWRGQEEVGVLFRDASAPHPTVPLDWAVRLAASARANRALRMHNDQLRSAG